MEWTKAKEIWVITILTLLCIACFPANPLVLSGVFKTAFYRPSFIIGWIVWAVGMMLVIAPIIMFPRRSGVAKGKTFVHATKLVDIEQKALVVGGGIAGIQAALDISEKGIPTYLLEKTEKLGGRLNELNSISPSFEPASKLLKEKLK